MKFDLAPRQFRPVTITLETQDDFDKLQTIIDQVAENRITHSPNVIAAARQIAIYLRGVEEDQQ